MDRSTSSPFIVNSIGYIWLVPVLAMYLKCYWCSRVFDNLLPQLVQSNGLKNILICCIIYTYLDVIAFISVINTPEDFLSVQCKLMHAVLFAMHLVCCDLKKNHL